MTRGARQCYSGAASPAADPAMAADDALKAFDVSFGMWHPHAEETPGH